MHRPFATALLLSLVAAAGPAGADTLLIDRVQQAPVAMPARGMSMDQVQASFGAPAERLEPRGGQKRQWPTINRWRYPGFVVYFEKNRVVDAVALQADPSETGPKPPVR